MKDFSTWWQRCQFNAAMINRKLNMITFSHIFSFSICIICASPVKYDICCEYWPFYSVFLCFFLNISMARYTAHPQLATGFFSNVSWIYLLLWFIIGKVTFTVSVFGIAQKINDKMSSSIHVVFSKVCGVSY